MMAATIAHVSSLRPTRCGVAEYAETLASEMAAAAPWLKPQYLALDPCATSFACARDKLVLNPEIPDQIDAAATVLNSQADVVILLQHEFKLYGGVDGENLCYFLEKVRAPIISTLHTVRPDYPSKRQQVIEMLGARSSALIVFSDLAAEILQNRHRIYGKKVHVIPHGVPNVPFRDSESPKEKREEANHTTFLSAGLIRPTKGIEAFLTVLGNIKHKLGPFSYIICGADHPRNAASAEYRRELRLHIARSGLESHVVLVDEYVTSAALLDQIQACDVGVLTYTAAEQSSSGILALFLACGRPVLATDFQAARAILSDENGIVVPMANLSALEKATLAITHDRLRRKRMMTRNYELTRGWIWATVARSHVGLIESILRTPH